MQRLFHLLWILFETGDCLKGSEEPKCRNHSHSVHVSINQYVCCVLHVYTFVFHTLAQLSNKVVCNNGASSLKQLMWTHIPTDGRLKAEGIPAEVVPPQGPP